MNRQRLSTTNFTLRVVATVALALSIMSGLRALADIPVADQRPAAKQSSAELPVLHLNNGDFATGNLGDCDDPAVLRWQCAAATEPFDFFLSSVSGVYFPAQKGTVKAGGDFCVELAGGDLLFGSIAAITSKEVVLNSPRLGTLHIDRKNVLRLVRQKDATEMVYAGPHGLSDWEQAQGQTDWREEAGELVTDRSGASLFGKVALPPQASIDIDLSWKNKPDFLLALGCGAADDKLQPVGGRQGQSSTSFPYSISTLNASLIACRETSQDADIAQLRTLSAGPGQLHLQIYLDQERGQMLVYGENGKLLGDLSVADAKPRVEGGIRLINRQGDLRLERLRVSRGSAIAPHDFAAASPHISKTDGSAVDGEVESFDPASRQFIVNASSGAVRVDANQVNSIVLASRGDARPSGAAMRVAMNDGACLSGTLEKVGKGQLSLSCPGITESVAVPIANVQSIVVLTHDSFTPQEAGRTGRLELEGVRLKGCLTESHDTANADASCLVWHPQSSRTGASLRKDIAGRVVYRDPPPAPPKNVQQAQQPQRQAGQIVINNGGVLVLQGQRIQGPIVLNAVAGALADEPARPAAAASGPSGPALYLRAGDVIPCRVTGITEEGVQFQSPITDAKFVPHSHVKAVELMANSAARPLDKARRERLLTLPRMQRDNPPTQLVVSTNGDYLRGRLNEMDDKNLKMEVQLENRQLARSRVAKIIWFHADELDPAVKPAEEPAPDVSLRVQAQRNDGVRLTFLPERMSNMALSGASDVLGPCRVDLMQVDQLLIGTAIEQGAAQNLYGRWKLHHAKEPLFAQDNPADGANPNAGMQSPLVGKPAPDFELKLLDGGKFRLSQHKGHVVVLDFWATWCGPCVNAMPQVDKAVEELKDQNVELVAVNMQEDAKAIHTLLDRLELKPTVALDQDGKTAEKYAVTGIPQTVIIDPEGNIARLFIGAGPTFGEQLGASLKDVLGKNTPPAEAGATEEPKK
jgi:thiol-disulfide isomerase/thioredoxin